MGSTLSFLPASYLIVLIPARMRKTMYLRSTMPHTPPSTLAPIHRDHEPASVSPGRATFRPYTHTTRASRYAHRTRLGRGCAGITARQTPHSNRWRPAGMGPLSSSVRPRPVHFISVEVNHHCSRGGAIQGMLYSIRFLTRSSLYTRAWMRARCKASFADNPHLIAANAYKSSVFFFFFCASLSSGT